MSTRYQRMITARRYARRVRVIGPSSQPGMVRVHELEPNAAGNWEHRGSVDLRHEEANQIYPGALSWQESEAQGIRHGRPVQSLKLPSLRTPSMVPKPQPKKPVPLPGASNLKTNKPGGM
jgi:hypothetical protein